MAWTIDMVGTAAEIQAELNIIQPQITDPLELQQFLNARAVVMNALGLELAESTTQTVGRYFALDSEVKIRVYAHGDATANSIRDDIIIQPAYVNSSNRVIRYPPPSPVETGTADGPTPTPGEHDGFIWGPAPETVDFIIGNNDSIESALETIFTGMSYTDYDFGQPTTVNNGIAITNCSNMTSLSFRLLESVEDNLEANTNTALVSFSAAALTEINGGSLDLTDCDVLASVSVPSLVTLGASWLMTGCPLLASLNATSLQTVTERFEMTSTSLTAISLPSLTTVGEGFLCNDSVLLESFSAPLWLPTDGAEINFDNCALDATSVNHVLARCVAAGVTTSTIELANGTNAAPTGQGLVDKADLITAGNTVNTN